MFSDDEGRFSGMLVEGLGGPATRKQNHFKADVRLVRNSLDSNAHFDPDHPHQNHEARFDSDFRAIPELPATELS